MARAVVIVMVALVGLVACGDAAESGEPIELSAGAPAVMENSAGAAPLAVAGSMAVQPNEAGFPAVGGAGGSGGSVAAQAVVAGAGESAGASGSANAAGHAAAAGSGGEGGVGGSIGSQSAAGSAAPVERVLWSQDWSCGIHTPMVTPGVPDAQFGLTIDAGEDCRFGEHGDANGMQTFATDGACVARAALPQGSAILFNSASMPIGQCGGTSLVGFAAAVAGHHVTALRRTQSYTVSIQGADPTFNYGDFTGKWEALGY